MTPPETTSHPAPRPRLRAVALPTEHGGWGLTAEPALLGLLLAPTLAGAGLALAAMLAFVIRTPLRVVLVDRHRGRRLPRTVLARRVVLAEGVVLVTLVGGAALLAEDPFWWPAAVAAPLVGLELWFDTRSRSRRLLPELAGAIGVGAVAAMIVLAAGHPSVEAAAAWCVVAARATTAIPHVRSQILRMHGRPTRRSALVVTDLACLAGVVAAVALEPAMLAGAVAVVGVVGFEWVTDRRVLPPRVIGIRQTVLGVLVVVVTALGAHLS